MDFAELSAPFPPEAIHWRAQTVTRNGDKALALAYLDARDVQDRLDAVCGPANWRDSYVETPKGRTICTLEIRVDGEWIGKSDGAGDTDVEGEKGSISDALKRAAVKWGIGRYLYDLGNVWAPCESSEYNGKKKWQKWKPEADRDFTAALSRLTGSRSASVTLQIKDDVPASVEAFLDGLTKAYQLNEAESYWTKNWPGVPKEWRPYALEQKEQIKVAQSNVALLRAG